MMSNLKKYVYGFLLLLLLVITVFGFFLPQKKTTGYNTKASGTGATLSFIPSPISAPIGTSFTVTVTLNTNGKIISAAELHLTYDPTKVEGQMITSAGSLPIVIVPGTIGNGAASIILGSDATTPKNNSGIVATLTFKSLSSDSSAILFSPETKVAAIGESTNVAAGMVQVEINGANSRDTNVPSNSDQ